MKKHLEKNITVVYDGPIVTLKAARDAQLTRYFTGKPCPKGHVGERYTKGSACISCFNEYQKEYAKKKRGKNPSNHTLTKQSKAKAKENGEQFYWSYLGCKKCGVSEGWRFVRKHRCVNCADIKWRNETRRVPLTPEEKKKRRNLHDRVKVSRRHKRLKDAEGSHTASQIRDMLKEQDSKCAGCGVDISEYFERDHIIPVSKGGSDDISNIQLLCRSCNQSKSDMMPDEWLKKMQCEN